MTMATLKNRTILNKSTHLLTFETREDLGFVGGQYIILNSGIDNGNGKPYKRTYSIFSSDDNQREFQIAYKLFDKGIVTNQYLNLLKPGEEITFSGPWGKFLKEEEFIGEGEIFVLATDTGIASAVSFINSKKLEDKKENISLYWMVPSDDYFVDFKTIKENVPTNLKHFEIILSPEFGTEERKDLFNEAISLTEKHSNIRTALLSGDGKIVHGLKEFLMDKGISEKHIGTEVYFNKDRI